MNIILVKSENVEGRRVWRAIRWFNLNHVNFYCFIMGLFFLVEHKTERLAEYRHRAVNVSVYVTFLIRYWVNNVSINISINWVQISMFFTILLYNRVCHYHMPICTHMINMIMKFHSILIITLMSLLHDDMPLTCKLNCAWINFRCSESSLNPLHTVVNLARWVTAIRYSAKDSFIEKFRQVWFEE